VSRVRLLADTLRHLRWEQWVYRPLRRVQSRYQRPSATSWRLDPSRVTALREAVIEWGPQDTAAHTACAERVARGEFRFLNHSEIPPRVHWRRRYVSHLWSYNLHYFDFARDLAWAYRETGDARHVERFQELASDWMEQVGEGGGDGWEPYALSLRLVNWTYAWLLFDDALEAGFRDRLLDSIAAQANHLRRNLELHLLGNHLQKNLHALIVAALPFGGPAAREIVADACRRLWVEIDEQVLEDGTHFELSPMYHAIALGDFLEDLSLLDAAGIAVPGRSRTRVGLMVEALGVLSRPDGRLHLFNDAAHGIAPPVAWLKERAAGTSGMTPSLRSGSFSLPDGGYFGWADPATGERLLLDCGTPGPGYQPGHAHCDLLSFELDFDGRPVIVDSGTSGYGGDPFRAYARSTRAHNTVEIGGLEQTQVWGDFRVARRAAVISAELDTGAVEFVFSGAYRPYHDATTLHHRSVRREEGRWVVTDRVTGAVGASLRSFIHLHPDVELEPSGEGFLANAGSIRLRIQPHGVDAAIIRRGELQPVQGWYLPEFGRAIPAAVLELTVHDNRGLEFGYLIERLDRNS
jgi:uncharacterized heparinase superfamily protein